MALEAAFMLATRVGERSTLHEMLNTATHALDRGHRDSADWLGCVSHTGLDRPDAGETDEQRG